MELAQESYQFLLCVFRGVLFPGGQQTAVKQLVNGNDGCLTGAKVFPEPAAHAADIAGGGIIILQFGGGRCQLETGDSSGVNDKLLAGWTPVQGNEDYFFFGCASSGKIFFRQGRF